MPHIPPEWLSMNAVISWGLARRIQDIPQGMTLTEAKQAELALDGADGEGAG